MISGLIATLGLRVDARPVREGERALDDLTRTGERTERQVNRVSSSMHRMARMAAQVAAALAVIEAVKIADQMALMDARLKLATQSLHEFAQAQRDVYDIAQKNAVSIASVTDLYTKLSDPIRRAGGGVNEVKGIVDAFSTSLRVGGASADDASRAILQFSQAMGQGKLSGDEFTSIAETSPRFLKALAEGANLPIEKLKQLGSEGKLTADVVGNALLKSIDKLNAEAATLPETVGGAFTRIKNDIAVSIREINQLGITGGIAGMLDEIRKTIPTVKDELVGAFSAAGEWVERNRKGIGEAWELAKGLVGDVWEVAKAAGAVVGFLGEAAVEGGALRNVLIGARYMVAGFQDGVRLIGAGFAGLGSIILQNLIRPLEFAMKGAAGIAGAFDTELEAKILGAMKSMQGFASAGMDYAKGVVNDFASGKTAVVALERELNGVKLTTDGAGKAAKKAAEAFNLLKGAPDADAKKKAAEKAEKEREKALKAEEQAREAAFQRELAYQAALSGADAPIQERIDAARRETEQVEELARTIGMSTLQIEQNTLARLKAQMVSGDVVTEREIAAQKELIALQERKVAATATIASGSATSEPQKLLDIMEALDDAARSAAQGMADAFGAVGSAIGDLTTAMTGYERTQAAIAAKMAETIKANPAKAEQARAVAARESAQAQLRSYGDMAKAAKGFFKENSAGYRAMEGAEKAYRAFEMAMAIKTMVEKSGMLTAFTSLFVASKATETAATVASVGPDVAASQAKGMAAAAAGVAGQAQGDPYTAFARMAAMAAAMAALGFAVSGGSKGSTLAKDRQAATGTGSVLGDKSAKSESIARAIELSAANSNIELNYTQGMLRALLSIENQIGGLGGILAQNGVNGIAPAKEYGAIEKALSSPLVRVFGPFLGKIAGSIFGGKTETLDVGVMANSTTVAGARAGGLNASSYVDSKKDGGWFRSDRLSTSMSALGAETNAQFSKIIDSMAKAVTEAGSMLGIGGDAFTQRLNAFVVDIGKISTKGLSGEEIQKQLEAAFSKVGDDMARWSVDGLMQFQKVGEGALETLVRLASNYANLDSALASIGMTFGATGMASLAAREHLIDLAGGIDELAAQTQSFADNFLTEAERLAPVQKYVNDELGRMGLSFITSREAFKQYVLGLDLNNERQAEQYVSLMQLQDAFAKVTAATQDASKSQQAIADERAELQDELDRLTMTETQLLGKQRNALDASNRALFDQVKAAEAQKKANDALRESMGRQIETFRTAADSLRNYGANLMTGNLSTLTPEQQLAEAQAQYATIAEKAMKGDEQALSKFQEAANKFLTLSQQVNGGDSRYSADYAGVLDMTEKLAKYADSRIDSAQAQIDALDRVTYAVVSLADVLREQYAGGHGTLTTPSTQIDTQVAEHLAAMRAEMQAQAEASQKLQIEAANVIRNATVQSGDKVAEAVSAPARRAPLQDSYATLDR